MKNKDFLKTFGFDIDDTDIQKANEKVYKLFGLGKRSQINVNLDTKSFLITKNNYPIAFMDAVWKALKKEDRLQIIFWAKESICEKFGLSDIKLVFFDKFEEQYHKTSPAYFYNGKIYANLYEFLYSGHPDSSLVYITHECIHAKQYANYDVMPQTVKKYLPFHIKFTKNLTNAQLAYLINLPLDGKVFNFSTQQFEYLDQKTKKDLLFLKNYFYPIKPNAENPFCKKSYVESFSDLKSLLDNLTYYTSPMEFEAYTKSTKFVLSLLDKNLKSFPATTNQQDRKARNSQFRFYQVYLARRHTIQKYFNMNANQVFDMYVKNQCAKEDILPAYVFADAIVYQDKKYKNLYNSKFKKDFTSKSKIYFKKQTQQDQQL